MIRDGGMIGNCPGRRRLTPHGPRPGPTIRELIMDDIARGMATAALTLQSVLLQALVHKGFHDARRGP